MRVRVSTPGPAGDPVPEPAGLGGAGGGAAASLPSLWRRQVKSIASLNRSQALLPLVIAGLALPARLAACVQPTDPLLTYDCECCWLAGWQVWLPPCVG